MEVTVVGAGPGAAECLTLAAREKIAGADLVLTSAHLQQAAEKYSANSRILSVTDTIAYINDHRGRDESVCVLASGDTGFYSIAQTIRRRAPEGVSVEFIPGISSMQYFCAVTGHSYETMKLISLHGRAGSIVPHVCYSESVFTLTGGDQKAGDLVQELNEYGLGGVRVYVGENLTMEGERIVSGTAEELSSESFGDLAVMIIDNPDAADPYRILADDDFTRGKAPMTKAAVRILSSAALAIRPSDVVYDIGAGTGAMTCVMAAAARESFVYAKDEEALSLARLNSQNLSIRNIRFALGEAPEGLSEFPVPDKVFIGGSSGNLKAIVETVLGKNPAAVLLVTAVTMETVTEAFQLFKELGLAMDIQCVNVANAHKLGRYELMKADNPVYLIRGERKREV